MSETQMRDPKTGRWVKAEPEPYYPNWIESLIHFFGFHTWTYTIPRRCCICRLVEE